MAGMYTPPTPSNVEHKSPEGEGHAAQHNRVYLAMGPIIGAMLIANLITAAIVAALYAVVNAH